MTKLSEKLAKLADAGGTLGPVYGVMADDARDIEQTAQELEERAQAAEARLKWHEETQRTYYDAEARAAAAEAEALKLDEESYLMAERLHAAEAEAARLRDDLAEALAANDSIPVRDNLIKSLATERDALRAKLDAAREWARGLAADNRQLAVSATLNEESAERLADELADALARAKAAEAEIVRLRDERDALRAKLDKVRRRAEDEGQGDHIYFEDILDILDGKGGT